MDELAAKIDANTAALGTLTEAVETLTAQMAAILNDYETRIEALELLRVAR